MKTPCMNRRAAVAALALVLVTDPVAAQEPRYDGPRELEAIRPLIEAELRTGTTSTAPKPPPGPGTRPAGGEK